ncbi:MAG: transcriptional regulator [Rhodobacteraceae bacterium]|nr:MAG: transcriptional regulator [Paracoccaceae bacterium]
MLHSLTGTRIRQQRGRIGLSQTALARQVGISTSYLNLIEHNKRGIAGKVLLSIARELGVPPSTLTEDADSELTTTLLEAAAAAPDQSAETFALAEFAGRFPGWSQLLASIHRQYRDQEAVISALSDRLTHDPFLAESLHLMLSNITAIRSTAEILTSVEDISSEQRNRFDAAIHEESKRLSDATQALIQYFDRETPQDAPSETPDGVTKDDVASMPFKHFSTSAEASDYNPSALASEFRKNLHAVFRRLASLNGEGGTAPEMGLIITNAAGQTLHRQALSDFPLPRHGNACPLWPVFQGFSQPERPLQDLIELPGGAQFVTLTVALPRSEVGFDAPPDYQSAMLFLRLEQSPWSATPQPARAVGVSCRICPRKNCTARSEETVL